VKKVTSLSYRQLNDWDAKRVLPAGGGRGRAWRRFSPRDLFVIAVLARIRKDFGVPLERLHWLRTFMFRDGANHFRAASQKIEMLGVGVYVVTNLRDFFVMDTDGEMGTTFAQGGLAGDCIWLEVNPLVNGIRALLGEPELPRHGLGYRRRKLLERNDEQ